MRAFVTGATGFIGANLTRRLLRDGHTVSVLLRSPSSADRPLFKNCRVIIGDLMNTSGLLIGMEGCAVVFHLAAYTSPVSRDPSLPYRVNVTGSLNALKAAEECGVRKMIMCSTAGTLGYSPCGEILDKSSARYGIRGTEYEIKPIREGASVTISWLRSGLQSDEPF
jgi:nucleoside-diphosphate-sugar epimerase